MAVCAPKVVYLLLAWIAVMCVSCHEGDCASHVEEYRETEVSSSVMERGSDGRYRWAWHVERDSPCLEISIARRSLAEVPSSGNLFVRGVRRPNGGLLLCVSRMRNDSNVYVFLFLREVFSGAERKIDVEGWGVQRVTDVGARWFPARGSMNIGSATMRIEDAIDLDIDLVGPGPVVSGSLRFEWKGDSASLVQDLEGYGEIPFF